MKKLYSRLAVFLFLTLVFFAATYSLDGVTLGFSRLLPDNYKYLAGRAYSKGDYDTAAQICRKRIAQFTNDFDARFLLADTLTAAQKPQEAADAMRDALSRIPGIRASKSKVTGFDEGRLYLYLAIALWDVGDFRSSGEMTRAALDAGSVWVRRDMFPRLLKAGKDTEAAAAAVQVATKTADRDFLCTATAQLDKSTTDALVSGILAEAQWAETIDRDSTKALSLLDWCVKADSSKPETKLAKAGFLLRSGLGTEAATLLEEIKKTTGTRVLNPGDFGLPAGGLATTDSLILNRSGTATLGVQTGVFQITTLTFFASGTRALGMYPVVTVKSSGKEVARLYIDSTKPKLYYLTLWPEGAPKSLDLKFEFTNDVYDPYTKSDRNVTLSNIMLL